MPVMKVTPSTTTLMADLLKKIEKIEETQKGRLERNMEIFSQRLRLLDQNDPRMTVAMIETSRDIQNSIVDDQKLCDELDQVLGKCRTVILSLSRLIKSMPIPVQNGPSNTIQKIKKRKSEAEPVTPKRAKPDEKQESVLVIDEEQEVEPAPST